MTPSAPRGNPVNGDAGREWLDGVLADDAREHRDAYVDDGGFTARVMDALPAPAAAGAALPAWRKPVLTGVWALATVGIVIALPDAAADAAQQIMRTIGGQHLSLIDVGGFLLALGAATWAGMGYALRKV